MNSEIIQDTIDFTLRAEHTIVNKTVKLIATVVALVAGDTTEEALRADIKATMKKLIEADWQFSNMTRSADASGWERVTLNASVRVPESENYNLDNRAKEASRKGLTITDVRVDTSVPYSMIEEAESDLRLVLIEKVHAERAKLERSLDAGSSYRIHSLSFSHVASPSNNFSNSSAHTMAMVVGGSAKTAYGSGFSDDDTLGNASKISMQVSVSLARIVGSSSSGRSTPPVALNAVV